MITINDTPRDNGLLSLADLINFKLDANGFSVDSDPVLPAFAVAVDAATGGGGANGQTITLFDQLFTTDDSSPYTFNTWDATGTPEQTSNNFANMLRSNYLFKDFDIQVKLVGGGTTWAITGAGAVAQEYEGWVFDQTGLLPQFVEFTWINGAGAQLNKLRIWYEIWAGPDTARYSRMGGTNIAFVPYSQQTGEQLIQLKLNDKLSRAFSLPFPIFSNTDRIQKEESLAQDFYIKFGGVVFDDLCNPTYLQGGQSDVYKLLYSAPQRETNTGILQHTIVGSSPGAVKWLSRRPDTANIPSNYYETINTYVPVLDDWGSFFVRWSFYDNTDTLLGVFTDAVNPGSVYQVAVGTGNLDLITPAGTSYYTIQLVGTQIVGGFPTPPAAFNATLRRNIVETSGCAGRYELYFIEPLGSFRTVSLPFKESEGVSGQAVTIEGPITSTPNASQFYQTTDYGAQGGGTTQYQEATRVVTYLTDKLTQSNSELYNEVLLSPRHYIKEETTDGRTVFRKVVLTRSAESTYQRGQALRLALEFTYNENLILLR